MHLLTAPTAEPVTLAEAKIGARVDSDDTALDALISGHIAAARAMAEQITGRRYMAQTWREQLQDWPAADAPVAIYQPSAVAVSYWTGSSWSTLSGSAFAYYECGAGTAVAPAEGTSWPALGNAPGDSPRVRIDLTVGAASATTVPEVVKTYIKACVSHWVNNPDAGNRGQQEDPLFARLLDSERLLWL